MYKQYCKVKVTIATCVVLTGEETSEKALRIFLFFFFLFLNKWEGVGGREELYGTFKLFTQGAVE